jgi:hypothetical protein
LAVRQTLKSFVTHSIPYEGGQDFGSDEGNGGKTKGGSPLNQTLLARLPAEASPESYPNVRQPLSLRGMITQTTA